MATFDSYLSYHFKKNGATIYSDYITFGNKNIKIENIKNFRMDFYFLTSSASIEVYINDKYRGTVNGNTTDKYYILIDTSVLAVERTNINIELRFHGTVKIVLMSGISSYTYKYDNNNNIFYYDYNRSNIYNYHGIDVYGQGFSYYVGLDGYVYIEPDNNIETRILGNSAAYKRNNYYKLYGLSIIKELFYFDHDDCIYLTTTNELCYDMKSIMLDEKNPNTSSRYNVKSVFEATPESLIFIDTNNKLRINGNCKILGNYTKLTNIFDNINVDHIYELTLQRCILIDISGYIWVKGDCGILGNYDNITKITAISDVYDIIKITDESVLVRKNNTFNNTISNNTEYDFYFDYLGLYDGKKTITFRANKYKKYDNFEYIIDANNSLWVYGDLKNFGNFNYFTKIKENVNGIYEINYFNNRYAIYYNRIVNYTNKCFIDDNVNDVNIYYFNTTPFKNFNDKIIYFIDVNNKTWIKGNGAIFGEHENFTKIEKINNISSIISLSETECIYIDGSGKWNLYDGINNIIYRKKIDKYKTDAYEYIIDTDYKIWIKGNGAIFGEHENFTKLEKINNISSIISLSETECIYIDGSGKWNLYDGINNIIYREESDKYEFSQSHYINDINGNLWVKGNNEYGKLGCDSNETLINNWTKINYIDKIKNISFVNEKSTSIKTENDEVYIVGKINDKIYKKFIKINQLNNDFNIGNEKKKNYKFNIKITDRQIYYLFSFKDENDFSIFNIILNTNCDIIDCTIINENTYTNYSINNNSISIMISEKDDNNIRNVFVIFDEKCKVDNLFVNVNSNKKIEINEDNIYEKKEYILSQNKEEYINDTQIKTIDSKTPIFYITQSGFKVVSIKKQCTKMSFYYETKNGYSHYDCIFLYIDGVYNRRCYNSWWTQITIDNLTDEEHEFTWVLYSYSSSYYSCIDAIAFNDVIEEDSSLFSNISDNITAPAINKYTNMGESGHQDLVINGELFNETQPKLSIISIKKKCSRIYCRTTLNNTSSNLIRIYVDGEEVYSSKGISNWETCNVYFENKIHEITFVFYTDSSSSGNWPVMCGLKLYDDKNSSINIDIENDFSNKYTIPICNYYENGFLSTSTPFYHEKRGVRTISIKKQCTKMSFYYKTYNNDKSTVYLYIDGVYQNRYYNTSWTQAVLDNLTDEEHEFTWVLCNYNDGEYSCIDTIAFDDTVERNSNLFSNKGVLRIAKNDIIFMKKYNINDIKKYKDDYNSNESNPFYHETDGIKTISIKKRCSKMSFSFIKFNSNIFLYIDGKRINYNISHTRVNSYGFYFTVSSILELTDEEHEFTWIMANISDSISVIDNITFDNVKYLEKKEYNDFHFYKKYEINKNGFFGSDLIEINKINKYDNKNKFLLLDINLDIGNTKGIINDINIKNFEYEDKEIIPFEDEKYKGSQFLYSIFYNSGIPFNKFIKFDGNLTLNGTLYPISYVKISHPIDDENKFGIIQFLIDDNAKIMNDISESNEITEINDVKEKIFGITIYPIIINDQNEYEYKIIDNIDNSLITQNSNGINIINNQILDDENFINRIVVEENKCILAFNNDIYVYDTIMMKPIYTKHFDSSVFNKINCVGIKTYENIKRIVIKCENGINYILSKDTLDVITSTDDDIMIDNKNVIFNTINFITSSNVSQKVKKLYKKRYQITDNETKIVEINFNNNENYFAFIYNKNKNMYRISIYRDNIMESGFENINNIEIIPSCIESLDGILMCFENTMREGYPKSFDY